MIAIPIILILFFFVTTSQVIAFSLQDNIEVSKLENKLTKTQSQIGFLIIVTNTINDNEGSKQSSDFIINLLGTNLIPSSFPAVPIPQVQIVAIQEGQYSVIVNNTLGYEIVQQNECHGQIKAKEIKTCFITIDDSIQPLSIPLSQPIGGEDQSATAQPPPSSQPSQEPTVQPPSSQTSGGQQQSATAQPPSPLPPPQIERGGQQTPPTPLPPPQTEGRGGGDGVSMGGGSDNLPPGTPFHFTASGDFRDNTNTDENMAANNPEIVLIVGDFSYNGNAKQWWSENMDALNSLNVIAALGNHDEPNDDFLNLWPLNGGKWEFIYKVSNVAFVAFDTENNDPSTVDPLLAQAQEDPTVDHIIPFGHKTVFTPTPGNPLIPDADIGYFDVFKNYDKIRMILGGHNHFYARMNAVPGTDFIYVTVGNGGANPHQDSGESGAPPKQYVRSNGCLHCDVNNDTISCKMISNEGTIWDEFTITPNNPPTSDQDPAQAPDVVDSDQRAITQEIPSIENRNYSTKILTKPSLLPLPLPSLHLENK